MGAKSMNTRTQAPKSTWMSITNHTTKTFIRTTITRRMLAGNGGSQMVIGKACKKNKTTAKTTTTYTIIVKKLIAGNNNNGVRVTGIETTNGPTNCRKNAWIHCRTRAEIPGEPKGNNGKHRSNPNQKKTASKAKVRA